MYIKVQTNNKEYIDLLKYNISLLIQRSGITAKVSTLDINAERPELTVDTTLDSGVVRSEDNIYFIIPYIKHTPDLSSVGTTLKSNTRFELYITPEDDQYYEEIEKLIKGNLDKYKITLEYGTDTNADIIAADIPNDLWMFLDIRKHHYTDGELV